MGGKSQSEWDFFVSYTQADRAWAEWIAWVLEEDGRRVLVQAWDFVPGSNWVEGMQAGTRDAARTIAVLSTNYLASVYGRAEWQAAVAGDPDGARRRLLIVRVNSCERPGLLAAIVGVDLFGVGEAAARDRLLKMVLAAASGRAKPAVAPRFPGADRAVPQEPGFPGGRGGAVGRAADRGAIAGTGVPRAISAPRQAGAAQPVAARLAPLSGAVPAHLARVLGGHTGVVLAMAFSPVGGLLATAGADLTVRLWEADTGKQR